MNCAWAQGVQPQAPPPPPLHLQPRDCRRCLHRWAQSQPRVGAGPPPHCEPPRWPQARGRMGIRRRGLPAWACCRQRRLGRGRLCAFAPSPGRQRSSCARCRRPRRGRAGRDICSRRRCGRSTGTLRTPGMPSHLVCPVRPRPRRAPAPARARRCRPFLLPCLCVRLQNRRRRHGRRRRRRARRRRCAPAARTAPATIVHRRHRHAAAPGHRPRHPPRGRWAWPPESAGVASEPNGEPPKGARPRPPEGWPEPRPARGAGACARQAPRSAEPWRAPAADAAPAAAARGRTGTEVGLM
jgi:hypothetical protein